MHSIIAASFAAMSIVAFRFRALFTWTLDRRYPQSCRQTFDLHTNVDVLYQEAAQSATSEMAVAIVADAMLALRCPDKAVFAGPRAFPNGSLPISGVMSDARSGSVTERVSDLYLSPTDHNRTWIIGVAALGVSAILAAPGRPALASWADHDLQRMLYDWPRHSSGAMSQFIQSVDVNAGLVAFVPAFLAQQAVRHADLTPLRTAVEQVAVHRQLLRVDRGPFKGLWRHDLSSHRGPLAATDLSGSGSLLYGMAKVRATMSAWGLSSNAMLPETDAMDGWIEDLLLAETMRSSGALKAAPHEENATVWCSAVCERSLAVAAVYRMAITRPEKFATAPLLAWADRARRDVLQDPALYASACGGICDRTVLLPAQVQQN